MVVCHGHDGTLWLLLKRSNCWWGGCLLGELESSLRSNYFIWLYVFLEQQDFVFCLTRVADCSWYLISAWVNAEVRGLLWQWAVFCCSFCFLLSLWFLLFLMLRKTTLRIALIGDVNYAGFNKITGSNCPHQIPEDVPLAFYKGACAVLLYRQQPCAVPKAKPTALSSRDLKLWSICFNFLTGHNYVLRYWIIFSSGCFTTYFNFGGFPCSYPLPDRGIGWEQSTAAAGTAVIPILWVGGRDRAREMSPCEYRRCLDWQRDQRLGSLFWQVLCCWASAEGLFVVF